MYQVVPVAKQPCLRLAWRQPHHAARDPPPGASHTRQSFALQIIPGVAQSVGATGIVYKIVGRSQHEMTNQTN